MSDSSTQNPYSTTNPAASQARTPRAIVLVNDAQIKFYDMCITTTTFYLSDSFKIELPSNGQSSTFNMNYWASVDAITIKIYIGFPPNADTYTQSDLELFMEGTVDDMEFDPGSARIMLSGRDLSSNFIDNKTTDKFSNQTSSQIVSMFAQKYGLKTQITPTSTPVGNYYSQQQVVLSNEITQWDLMTFLAQQENFVLFLQGDTLVFEPRPSDTNVHKPYIIQYVLPTAQQLSPTINVVSLGLSRSMTLTRDSQVTIRVPHGTKTGEAFSVTAKSTHRSRANLSNLPKPSKQIQKYSITKAGLTQEQASQLAQQRLREITSHEIKLTASVPGDNTLKKDSLIQLVGTNTAFDQYYYSDQIVRRFNFQDGYTMDISAKNSSVDSQVTI